MIESIFRKQFERILAFIPLLGLTAVHLFPQLPVETSLLSLNFLKPVIVVINLVVLAALAFFVDFLDLIIVVVFLFLNWLVLHEVALFLEGFLAMPGNDLVFPSLPVSLIYFIFASTLIEIHARRHEAVDCCEPLHKCRMREL